MLHSYVTEGVTVHLTHWPMFCKQFVSDFNILESFDKDRVTRKKKQKEKQKKIFLSELNLGHF